jgi:hypothetical protein
MNALRPGGMVLSIEPDFQIMAYDQDIGMYAPGTKLFNEMLAV